MIRLPSDRFQLSYAPQFTAIGLAIVALIALVYRLGGVGLIDETEPLFAEAARQMVETGNWITPYYNEATRFDKPPLVYWLMAIGYGAFGVNAWTVRLPSAIAAIALMSLVCWVVVQCVAPPQPHRSTRGALQPWLAGGLAGSIAVLNLHTLVWGRTGVSDMLLSGCMGGALLAFFMGYRSLDTRHHGRSRLWFGLFYSLLALAVLTKGPVGIVLPGVIILGFLLLVGQLQATVRSMGLWWGVPLFSAIVVPWFVLVIAENGAAYIDNFFGYHNVARFTRVVNHHSAPWYFYILVIGVGFFPWSAYLPAAIARFRPWQIGAWRSVSRSRQLPLFALCWFGGIFGFFSIAVTKLPSYVLPLMPAGAIVVAIVLAEATFDHSSSSKTATWLTVGHHASLVLWLLWAIAIGTIPLWYTYDPAVPNIDRQLIASGVCQAVGLRTATIALVMLAIIRLRRPWTGSAQIVCFCLFAVLSFHPLLTEVDRLRQEPIRAIAAEIQAVRQPDEPVALFGFEKPSLVFYLRDRVTFLDRVADARQWLGCQTAAVLLITDEARQEELELPPTRLDAIGEYQRYRLARIHPTAAPRDRSDLANCVPHRER